MAGRLDESFANEQFQKMWRMAMSEFLRYLRVAPFPHLTTVKVAALAVVCGCEAWLFLEQPGFSWLAWVWIVLTGLFAWGVILCQADAFSRYREFKRLRHLLRRYGFRPGIFRLVAASRCQRDAALLAARETGCRSQACRVFRELGYRWYHILPDAIVANPFVFFHPRFLRSTFIPGKRS
jgi:hypothetical protein